MFEHHNDAVYGVLQDGALVDATALAALRAESQSSGRALAALVIERGGVTGGELVEHLATACGCGYVREVPGELADDVIRLIDGEMARRYGVVPLRAESRTIDLLTANPLDGRTAADLSFLLDREVRLFAAEPGSVEALIRRYYGGVAESSEMAAGKAPDVKRGTATAAALSPDDLEALAGQTPIIHFVNLVLGQAIRDKASDIHFEPFESEFKIRYRIDGALYEMTPPPPALALPVISRIKVLANLNIAERRVPQDGRIKLTIGGRSVDLRVSTLPTQFGESVVLRVLDQSAVRLNLSELGLKDEVLSGVSEIIRRPNGIFVVTGPTGSGKTTTLYSCIRAINAVETKILTAEDPVEYEVEGIMQVPVNPAIGFTFATALRSFLRQDPDVIMVGEIRDLETAQIAIQASLTGHLVLTTLHTNDAAGAVTRLSDMGMEPFLIANSVEAVLAQRLLRRVCVHCRMPGKPSKTLLENAGIDLVTMADRECLVGRGCPHCANTGYRGRVGIFEWMPMAESLRGKVVARAPAAQLRQAAIDRGMQTLREAALAALWSGATSLDEVVRYT